MTKQQIYDDNLLLSWIEPESGDDSSAQVWFIHAQDAAAIMLDLAKEKQYTYPWPVEAMIDFIVIHWAITENTFHVN